MLLSRMKTVRAHKSTFIEPLEGRMLMSANVWKAAVSGDWSDASKWSLKHVPTSAEDVTISVAGNYTVKHASSAANAAKSVTVSAGTLELDAGSIALAGGAVKASGGTFTLKGGTLAKATLSTSGNGKVLSTSSGGALDGITLSSNLSLATGTYLNLAHTLTFTAGVKLTVGGAHVYLVDSTDAGGSLAGQGMVLLSGGLFATTNSHGHGASIGASVAISGYGQLTFAAATNSGTVQADVGGKTLALGGSLTNKGVVKAMNGSTLQITNPSSFSNQGTIAATVGTVLINGAFKCGTGTVSIGLAGTSQGSTYGVIKVAGALTLGGTLNVTELNGYVPANGTSFIPLTYTSHTGSFATTNLPAGSATFNANYSATALTLTASTVTATRGAIIVGTLKAKGVHFGNGIYDVIDFKLTQLIGQDALPGRNGRPPAIDSIDGTWTATGSVGTPMLAVPGASSGQGLWSNYVVSGSSVPNGYGASFVNFPSNLGSPTRSGTGTSTSSGGKVTAITGESKSFGGIWFTFDPNTSVKVGSLFAEILVTPGNGVTFTGVYNTYGAKPPAQSVTFSYTP